MPWLSGTQQTLPQINATFGSASVLNSATLNLDLVLLNKRKVYCGVPTCNFQILGLGDSLTPTSSTTSNQLAIFYNEFITFKEDALIPVMTAAQNFGCDFRFADGQLASASTANLVIPVLVNCVIT